jgi:membrane protease YdiL (CAAX protease family)
MVRDGRDYAYEANPATPVPMARRHWWSPAPTPPLPPISTRRAYTEVLLVFGAFFLAGVVGAVVLLANRYDNPFQNASWSDYSPEIVDVIAQTGLAVAIVLLLGARRGVTPRTLGLTLPHRADGRVAAGQATRILAWAVFAQVLGGVINAALQTGHLPTSTPNAPELIFSVADSIQAGIIEELVVLAFVVVTLRQAGRAWWEVTVVALVLRGSYHIYYGPGVVGILVWAALFYWIYVRTRSLILLMACHTAWDTVVFLSQRWSAIAGVAIVVAAGLWIAAPITWLVERNNPGQDSTWRSGTLAIGSPSGWQVGMAPPGWQPDPAGVHYWRWWDGQRWTEHVSGP